MERKPRIWGLKLGSACLDEEKKMQERQYVKEIRDGKWGIEIVVITVVCHYELVATRTRVSDFRGEKIFSHFLF